MVMVFHMNSSFLLSPFLKGAQFFIFEIILSSHFEIVISNQGFVSG